MKPDQDPFCNSDAPMAAPSADFIQAISKFLDTDPDDLLVELGYYNREQENISENSLVEMTAQQE